MKNFWAFVAIFALNGGFARADTIAFEDYSSGTQITTQYSGITFAGAMQLDSSDVSPEFYTPESGNGFIGNIYGSDISMTFTNAQDDVTGWYMDWQGATLTAYDADGNLLLTQILDPNLGGNALFDVDLEGVMSIDIDSAAGPGTMALDDVTYDPDGIPAAVTPEPGSLVLLGTGLCLGAAFLISRSRRKLHHPETELPITMAARAAATHE